MAAWTAIPDSDLDPESPITTSLMLALRDNPVAITENASGSPGFDVIAEQTPGNGVGIDSVVGSATVGTGEILFCKAIKIGTWDMDFTSGLGKPHGLDFSKIRSVTVIIRNDLATIHYDLTGTTGTATAVKRGAIRFDSTNIIMDRTPSGFFDNADYDVMGGDGNRGWITILYAQ